MNKRFLRPAVAVCALLMPVLLYAQTAPKKSATQPQSARPTTGASARPGAAPATTEPPTTAKPTDAEPAVARDARPAAGSEPGEHVRVGISAGLAAPMSSLGRTRSAGFTAGGFLRGRPEGFPVALRGDVQYTSFGRKAVAVDPSYSVIQVTGAAVYDFPAAGGEKSPFFATGGLGLYRWTTNDESQTDFGQNLGFGFALRKYRFQPFVEGRFHFFNDIQYFTLTIAGHL